MDIADLNAFGCMALALKFLALFWSVRLYNRLHDPRMGALAIILAISLAWTIVTYASIQLPVWMMSPAYMENIPSVTIGILMLLIVMCLSRVIEEERQTDKSLRLSKFTLDHSPNTTLILGDAGNFEYVNESACESLGYSREELLESNIYEISVDLAAGFWKQHWRELKEKGATTLENQYRTKSGRIVPCSISAHYMEHRGVGYDCSVVTEIGEQRAAEEALRRSENAFKHQGEVVAGLVRDPAFSSGRLDAALQRITKAAAETLEVERVGVWVFNQERTTIHCLRLYERGAEQFSQGQELTASDYPKYFEAVELDRVIDAESAVDDERTSEFASGYLEPLGITSMLDVPIRRSGKVAGVICHEHVGPCREWKVDERAFVASIADLAAMAIESYERKSAEQALEISKAAAEEADRGKSEFLAQVSRQIRTPMNGILGMTELLLSTDLSGKQQEFANTIRSSADTLLNVMHDILRFSGDDDENSLIVDTVDFDLRGIVEEVVSLVAEQAHSKRLELSAAVGYGVPTKLIGDPMRLWQVLTTIVGNAVRYTESGEVLARVSKESETSTHVIVRFEVADTGVGIDGAAQGQVFAERQDGTTSNGTRLGLVICKRIVEALGGEIGFYSEPSRGSTFWFTMLFEKNVASRTARPKVDAALRDARVLVVDDNPTSRSILVDFLNAALMRNAGVSGADEAVDTLTSAVSDGAPFDLAIIDHDMPGSDGLELAKSIKADAALHTTKILFLSNTGNPLGEERMRKAGIAAETAKPVKMGLFFEALAKAADVAHRGERDGPESSVAAYLSMNGAAGSPKVLPGERRRVLVADDNLVNQKVALLQLQKLGCEPVSVSNGFEVLEALESAHYDLVLMDCKMHDMDGFETTTEIRRREFAARTIPIIGTIAHTLEGDHEQCIVAGMNDTITKPLKLEELTVMIDRWISAEADDAAPEDDNESRPGLDIERLRAMCEGNSSGLTELIESYLRHTQAQLESLYIAIRLGTTSEVERITKTCIDASESCGITAIVPTLKALEDVTRAGEPGQAQLLGRALSAEFERVRAYLAGSDPEALLRTAATGPVAETSPDEALEDPSAG